MIANICRSTVTGLQPYTQCLIRRLHGSYAESRTRAREAAEAREEQERHEKEQLRHKSQLTTLDKYLRNCHTYLYKSFKLADKSVSSTGFTKVDGKFYPKWLRPWTQFADSLRQQQFDVIVDACGDERLFHQESTTRDIGSSNSHKLAGNENAVASFEKVAVEDPVFAILRQLGGQEAIRAKYGFSRLRFSDNNREITHASGGTPLPNEDLDTEEPERRRAGPNKRAASELRRKPRSTNPDGAGLRTRPGGDESLAFVYDYKAAHKIAADHVNLAISKETLFMEVVEQVNRTTSRTGATQVQSEAEARLAMALTQVFDYMVTYGVGYGYVAAGESLLLLHVDRADPQTLFCHPCVPSKDVGDASCENWAEQRIYTAVAQLSSFCMLSLQSDALQGPFLDAALKSAKAVLKTWAEPYEDAAQFSAEETESSQAASSSPARRADPDFVPDESPIGRKVALRSRPSCRPPASSRRDDEGEDEDGPEDDLPPPWTRSVEKRKGGPSHSSSEEDETRHSAPTRQYCSQACLLGLKRGWGLDDGCPNVLAHRVAGDGLRHPVTADEFTRLVSEQLRDSPYRGCLGLGGWGKRGATGVLFKVELGPYGYTFVGKGTLSGGLEQLQHECRVYARLATLEGWVVPVHLGLVHLDWGYVLPGGRRVVHMMLMSWGGETAADAGMEAAELEAQRRRSSEAVWAAGVDHGDLRDANLLWNVERGRVMVIDFDQAVLRPAPKHRQVSAVRRKRKHGADGLEGCSRKRSLLYNRPQPA